MKHLRRNIKPDASVDISPRLRQIFYQQGLISAGNQIFEYSSNFHA